MVIPIPSNKSRFTIKLVIRAFRPFSLGIIAFDSTRPNTHYFRRKVTFQAAQFKHGKAFREISIPMPVSPKSLALELIDKYSQYDDAFQIDHLKVEKMPPAQIWETPERHRFMEFAIGFAQRAGYASTGFYNSPDKEFLIQFLPAITDQEGNELVTPARIHRQMPRVQISRKAFKRFSIPVRVAILSHEGCHFFRNTRSEKAADLCGIKYYLDYGFPKIEAVYAATKVFLQHPESVAEPHVTRTQDIMNMIDNYEATKKIKKVA
jgi:hypothetical protein